MSKELFDNDICHVTFTHSECSDIWPAYFGEMHKFFNSGMKHYVCVDKNHKDLPENKQILIYNSNETYPRRLLGCLNQLNTFKYIFFDHEDMFLFAMPELKTLSKYYEVLRSGEVDHIRLIKGGRCKSRVMDRCDTLFKFDLSSKWIFSIQPSFWRISTLKEVLEKNLDVNIWDLERKGQKTVKEIGLKAAYSHDNSRRRGIFHFDNKIYPYISTAIGKGKWNYSEYKKELGAVFEAYGIDPNIRGVNSFFHR